MIDKENVLQLLNKGLNYYQIANRIGCSESAVSKCVKRNSLKESCTLDKDVIKRLYIQGLEFTEIANKLNSKESTIRMCIKRNFPELLAERTIKKTKSGEALYNAKINDYFVELESSRGLITADDITKMQQEMVNFKETTKQYMSEQGFVKFNRQSYITNSSGKLIYDEKTRGTRPHDLKKTPNLMYIY